MATGTSIHIGLNRVDPNHYQGWDGKLKGCENDAHAMEAIARGQGFTTCLLLNEQATAEAVTATIADAAGRLKGGDILLLTYSGHGGQVPDPLEKDEGGYDETWVLYNRQLLDDELYALWGKFEDGVRIFVLSDSCHSGSVVRQVMESPLFANEPPDNRPRPKGMNEMVRDATFEANKALYTAIEAQNPQGDRVGIGASLILISGCQDNQVSLDGDKNGLFTEALLKTWKDGKFKRSYPTFHKNIQQKILFFQSPNYFKVGQPDKAFERQRPFTI